MQRPEESIGSPDTGPDPYHGETHLADYWRIVSRRLWLVVLVFGVTTASAIWAVSRQALLYQTHLSLQVNDPLQRTRTLTPGPARISGMQIYVDPIQSEIEVFKSSPIAVAVVDSLGLRLRPQGDLVRSQLFRDARVAAGAAAGRYVLAYDDRARLAELRATDGTLLGSAAVGDVLDAGFVRFTPVAPPREERVYTVGVVPTDDVVPEVRGGLSATPRESTDIIDARYTSPDPVLAPEVLNAAAHALREYGARRVSAQARQDVRFIEEQLDSAEAQLRRSFDQIQEFKQTRAFTNLSVQEQELVNRTQRLVQQIEGLQERRDALLGFARSLESRGLSEMEVAGFAAALPRDVNPEVRTVLGRIQDQLTEIRRLVTEERKTEEHPQVVALRRQMATLESDLLRAVRSALQATESRLDEQSRELAALRSEQRGFPGLENELQTLELRQDLDEGTYQFLRSQLYQARITAAGASPYVDVVDPARVAVPLQPRGRLNVLLGALLGLILGVGAAFFLEYLDRTVRTSADVETLLGIPVLGIVPRLRRVEDDDEEEAESGRSVPLVVAQDPVDPAAEAYRNLRMNLMFMSTEDDPIRTILFSSPGPDEGKSTTAINFAVMLAQQGERVLMMDADLRRPQLHRSLDVLREPGLTNLLVGDADLREVVRPNVLPNLDFIPSGPFPPNPSELLNSRKMGQILDELTARYGQVILDSPPVLAVTDASVVGTRVDGVVLILRSGRTEQRAAERAVEQLRRIGVRVFGAVLNEVATSTTEESYYLQYYYSYGPRDVSGWERLRQGISRVRFW